MKHALYGFSLGVSLARRGHLRTALSYLIKPVNYWRTLEYEQTCVEADFAAGQKILDIGSPKLLALWLAETVGAEVWSTDIHPYFLEGSARACGARGIPIERLHLETQDGRKLTYADSSFDRVYSISVIEHILADGDSTCVKEIARVLRPGGRVVITVPFSPTSRDDHRRGNYYWAEAAAGDVVPGAFYERRYSEDDVRRRLIDPSGLRLRALRYVGETAPLPAGCQLADFLPNLSGPVQPLLSRLFHTTPTDDWRSLKKPLCVVLTLEKP